jgi:hypothetical protein
MLTEVEGVEVFSVLGSVLTEMEGVGRVLMMQAFVGRVSTDMGSVSRNQKTISYDK